MSQLQIATVTLLPTKKVRLKKDGTVCIINATDFKAGEMEDLGPSISTASGIRVEAPIVVPQADVVRPRIVDPVGNPLPPSVTIQKTEEEAGDEEEEEEKPKKKSNGKSKGRTRVEVEEDDDE